MIPYILLVAAELLLRFPTTPPVSRPPDPTYPVWQEGYLDIHHISTGRGNATFFVFPDGTTLLFDAGELDPESFSRKHAPLKVAPARPDTSRSAGSWITHYIQQVMPENVPVQLDYAVISHFHGDHYGTVTRRTSNSATGKYKLTGITQVGELIPIRTLIDRNYPQYDYPVNLKEYLKDDPTFQNYLAFINEQATQNGLKVQSLIPGSTGQIRLRRRPGKYPSFRVRNLKANNAIWTGRGDQTRELFTAKDLVDAKGKYNENPLSLALKISYGDFDYYTGGDNTGLQGYGLPEWFDVETPLAQAAGQVDAMTLNHHGNRDASNALFLRTLAPSVVVQQAWCSDQPGQEVLHRLITGASNAGPGSRIILATHMHPETQVTLGPWLTRNYQSLSGHLLIRVLPDGKQYQVYVLDDQSVTPLVEKQFGPFAAR